VTWNCNRRECEQLQWAMVSFAPVTTTPKFNSWGRDFLLGLSVITFQTRAHKIFISSRASSLPLFPLLIHFRWKRVPQSDSANRGLTKVHCAIQCQEWWTGGDNAIPAPVLVSRRDPQLEGEPSITHNDDHLTTTTNSWMPFR
jgi:hypothetical protein